MEFKTRLKRLREEVLDISQEEMAKRLEVSRNYVALLERGEKNPSNKIVHRVALIERGTKPLPEREEYVLLANSKDYFEDFDWLVRHGYGEELASAAKALRQVAEKANPSTAKEPVGQVNSFVDELAREALREAVETGEAEIESERKRGAGEPNVKKGEPSSSASKVANLKPSAQVRAQGGHERES